MRVMKGEESYPDALIICCCNSMLGLALAISWSRRAGLALEEHVSWPERGGEKEKGREVTSVDLHPFGRL